MSSAATIAGSPASSTTRAETAIAGSVRGRRARSGSPLVRLSCCAFAKRVRALRQNAFVVYAKPPFGGPERVLAYLARYTHRTAIANSRLVAVDDNEVAFSYKDYRRAGRERVMRLAPHEFIRRFLLHVLPDGFHRIRHYGFLPRATETRQLARARSLLQFQSTREPDAAREPKADEHAREPFAVCPDCGGLTCGASAMSPNARLPPSAATHRDIKSRPDLATAQPSTRRRRRCLPSPLAFAPLRPRPRHRHAAQISPPRLRNRSTVSSCQSPQRKQRLENQDRPRAFPIAANRPAPSFNPAYVRSPSATPNPCARDLT